MTKILSESAIKKLVHDQLDSAVENEFDIASMTVGEICDDMSDFADVGDLTQAQLAPHVQTWLDDHI